jgi:nucleotide-binding universal stress UspA family protein
LFKNIMIPTDGSDLAAKAVEQGVLFAKEIGAKITAVTVTEPFHLLSVKPNQLEYTPIEYKTHAESHANKLPMLFRLRPTQQVLPATRFTSSTNSSIRQSSKPPRRESAI